MIFIDINSNHIWHFAVFSIKLFSSRYHKKVFQEPTCFQRFYWDTQRGLHGGSKPNCSSQFLPRLPFLVASSTRRLSSSFCTRSDSRMAIYITVAFVFSASKDGKWTERTARVDEEKGPVRSFTWKDSTDLFALSATARVKGNSSRSLVKSATYPMILSSVEVIHDREGRTKCTISR